MNCEQNFIAELDRYEFIALDTKASIDILDEWRHSLISAVEKRARIDGLKEDSEIARQVDVVHARVLTCMGDWSTQWDNRAPAQFISDSFFDKAIFLVFGKVNAGKSSFCNFVAERFSKNGSAVQYFHIDQGHIVNSPDQFKEGATETTSRIQGVRLGEKLILLDTPGLHSVTPENGDLTRRFTESADAVLWLTSSTSPGQVQELNELQRELGGGKPLLPIVTKSDVYEEDEVDGEIKKILRNKTPENRALQEGDVTTRAIEKLKSKGLDTALLRKPVSVSSYMARDQDQAGDALDDSGFQRLYAELLCIVRQALDYKRRKAAEVMLNHLEENVLGALRGRVLPELSKLQTTSECALRRLEEREPQISSAVAQAVTGALPGILNENEARRDVKAVCAQVSNVTFDELTRQVNEVLRDYAVAVDSSLAQLAPEGMGSFEDRAIDVTVRKGAAKRAATGAVGTAAAAWAGAEAGAMLGSVAPGIGNAVGGLVGAFAGAILGDHLGKKAGSHFEETEIERRVVGVSYERLHAALEAGVSKQLLELVKNVVDQCRESIREVIREAARLEKIVLTHEDRLVKLREQIRHDPV